MRRHGAGRRYLRPQPCGRSARYLKVTLTRGAQLMVHRIVCEAFHGPPPGAGYHADHLDFDPHNNAAANLRWLPASVNIGRQLRRGASGWELVAEEDPPDDCVPLTPAELAELDERLSAKGW